MMNKIYCFFLFFWISTSLFAQEYPTFDVPLKKDVIKIPESIELGVFHREEKLRLALPLSLSDDWYIYSLFQNQEFALPSKLEFTAHLLKKEQSTFETAPFEKANSLGIQLLVHKKNPQFYQNFSIPKDHKFGKENFVLNFFYQLCSDRFCFPPEVKKINLHYQVKQGVVREQYTVINRQIDDNFQLSAGWKKIQNIGFWNFLLFAIVAGYLAWLTPCAFALLPLIVLFFSNQSTEKKTPSLPAFLFFLLGVSIVFVIFGLVISSFLGVGSLLNLVTNGWIFSFAALLFFFFALNLLGIFTWLPIPSSIQKKQTEFLLQSQQTKYQIGKILLGGSLFTITTLSCTFPLVGSLLVAASFGNWFYPIIGMFLFSFAFISPLFLFYFFPQHLQKWKNRKWVIHLKIFLAILMFFTSAKFLSYADTFFGWGIISRDITIFFLIICFFVWLVSILLPIFQKKKILFFPASLSLLLLLAIVFLTQGLQNKSLGAFLDALLPTAKGGYLTGRNFVSKEKLQSLQWFSSLETAKTLSQKTQKPILLDFSGKICTNCRWMEQSIFPQKQIFKILQENFILVRLYTDIGKDAQKNLNYQKDRFGNIALPFYAIISSNNQILKQQAGVMNKKQFQFFLNLSK